MVDHAAMLLSTFAPYWTVIGLEADKQKQLRILTMCLLFPHPLGAYLRCIPNPQLKLQVTQQARTSASARSIPFPPARLHFAA